MFSWVIQTTETEREKVSEMTSLQVGHFKAPGRGVEGVFRRPSGNRKRRGRERSGFMERICVKTQC